MPLIRESTRLLLLGGTALLAAFIAFIAFDGGEAISLVKHFGYWVMFLNVLALLMLLWREVVSGWHERYSLIKSCRYPAAFILSVTAILLIIQPSGFKIVMDEPVLASTALRMHEHKEVMVTVRAHEIQGVFTQLDGYVDKRPFFYPFLVSVVHDLTGYRSQNPILLNGLLTVCFLALLFHCGERLRPRGGGYFSVLLFATLPLLSMSANGGGFGMLNLVMILATGLAAVRYLEQSDVMRMDTLILMGVLLAQTRYESVLFVFPIALVVAVGWWQQRKIQISWLTICAPLFLVPYGLQRVIMANQAIAYELREGSTEAFSWSLIPENLIAAANFFFNVQTNEYPNSALISVFALFALLFLFLRLIRGALCIRMHATTIVCLSFAAVVIFNFFLLMSYHWGQLDDIMATRIALPFILLQVLLCVFAWKAMGAGVALSRGLFAAVFVFFFGFTIPSTAKNDYLQWVPGQHEVAWVQQQSQRFKGRNVLLISDVHLISIVERVPTIAGFWAKNNKAKLQLHLDLNTYDAVYYIHKMVADPIDGDVMVSARPVYYDYELELVDEVKLGDARYMRLSRIVSVNELDGEDLSLDFKWLPKTDLEKFSFNAETLP
ncbi:MAG: glycosyltransferase family 39 protein [Opitutaceae bacterium]